MKENTVLTALESREAEAEEIAERVIKKPSLLPELLSGIRSTKPEVKFGSAKTLRIISEKAPRTMYAHMDFFEKLLDSDNNILKWNAIDIIANLTVVDSDDRFNKIFRKFYDQLDEGNLITAGHVVDSSSIIAHAKPEFRDEIVKELLRVHEIPLPTEECRNILIGKTITAFDGFYEEIRDKEAVVSFVRRQLDNTRNATKSKAEKFLKKCEKTGKAS